MLRGRAEPGWGGVFGALVKILGCRSAVFAELHCKFLTRLAHPNWMDSAKPAGIEPLRAGLLKRVSGGEPWEASGTSSTSVNPSSSWQLRGRRSFARPVDYLQDYLWQGRLGRREPNGDG